MKTFIKVTAMVLSLPVLVFYCVITVALVFFALPSAFSGNPSNIILVIAWILGGYGIYSGAVAIISIGNSPYLLDRKHKIGIFFGLLVFVPLVIATPSTEIRWVWRFLACISTLPASLLLMISFVNSILSHRRR